MTLSDLRRAAELLPPGTSLTLSCEAIREALASLPDARQADTPPTAAEVTWRERIWTVPAETRLGAKETAEAIGRPTSFVYRATSAKTIPHRKLEGELTFVAGELRAWIRDQEEVITPGRMERAALALDSKSRRAS